MSKKRANIHPGLIGELFTDGTDYYKLIDCQSEPSATIERIRDVGITITKPISEFASLVLMKPIKPIVKPPAPRKVRADAGKPRERKPKVEQASTPIAAPSDTESNNQTQKPAASPKKRSRPPAKAQPTEIKEIADKKGDHLTIHVPTGLGDDIDYIVNIAGSEARGTVGLRVAILAALEEFNGKIPKELSDYERRTVQGILDAGE